MTVYQQTQILRQELWIKVFHYQMQGHDERAVSRRAASLANEAVEEFDKKFKYKE